MLHASPPSTTNRRYLRFQCAAAARASETFHPPMSRPRVALSWSSGKDSAWTLHRLRQDPGIEVAALVTTVNAEFNRVAMHAVRQELLHAQAEAAGLPLIEVPIPYPCGNAEYESRMRALFER